MLQMSRTTRRFFILTLSGVIVFAFLLFGYNLINALMLAKTGNLPTYNDATPTVMAQMTESFKNINLLLIFCFLFSIVFFIIAASFYVREKTTHIEHKYIKAKEATLKKPLTLSKDKTIKIRDYASIATLANTKHVPLLKYVFNDKTIFYYLVEGDHIYLYREYLDAAKKFAQDWKM